MHRPGRQGLTGNFFTTSLGNKVSKANPATFDFTTTTLPEVDVMITIFCEKIGVFLICQCYDQLFSKFSFVLSQKRQFFRKFFRQKYLKIHNTGPQEAP
jgi:hypothetical protein